jgi:DNA-directed RNA polymerase II subunit RPB1
MKTKNFTYVSKLNNLKFYVIGNEETKIDSNVIVNNKELFKNDIPVAGGVYDAHMGTTDHAWLCETCGNNKTLCPGHPGSIVLNYPVKNPIFRDYILKWLKIICFTCGNIVTDKIIKVSKSKLLTEYVKICRTITTCQKCKASKPIVSKNKYEQSTFYIEYDNKSYELFNHEIKNILNKISDDTVRFVGKPIVSHPKKFILDLIKVSPNTIRPDIRRIGGNRSNNSDITALTKNIIEINDLLPNIIPDKDKIGKDLREMYFNLDMTYYEMIKGSSGTNNQVRIITNTNKTPNSIASRIPKKEGRIRRNLMGKRVRYMMRSVITGDNMLKIDEIGVPISIAKSIQIPETVRSYNKDRLQLYFLNKKNVYPGCSGIEKNANHKFYKIEFFDDDYELQYGDIIMRDMINGDVIGFNRQPSLLYCSVSAHRVVVLNKGNTLCMNVSACNFYNADFDGDQMNGLVCQNIQARNELQKLSLVNNWVICYKDSAPKVGAFQDALIGMSEFTRSDVKLDKYHAMKMFAQIDITDKDFSFTQKNYKSREMFELFLPKINYPKKKSSLFMEQYTPFIKYNPEDTHVIIKRGKLIQGILDKSTIGQDVAGSIIHIINNEYGNNIALDTIYSMQQISTFFFMYSGFTIGIYDINVSDDAIKKVKNKTEKMILDSRNITQKLNFGNLTPPIGMTLQEYYEIEQINALEPGDDFVEPILADIDFDNNNLAKLVFTGSKGKSTNVIAINGAIGTQQINGRRMVRNFGYGRTSPYFLRFDMEPRSLGYISNSFREGITSDIFPFIASEARHGLINNALSTSITGHQNRLSIKNLESILIDNCYKSMKDQNLIQPLYAESGFDTRKTEKVKLLSVLISDKKMENEYHTKLTDVNKIYRNNNVKKYLDDEYNIIKQDRELYRHIFMKLESHNPGNSLFDNIHQLPINLFRIIENCAYDYNDIMEELPQSKKILDPIKTINKVKSLCNTIPYLYFNKIQEMNNMEIPEYIKTSTLLVCIFIRSYLCISNLLRKKINDILVDIIIKKIIIIFKQSLIDYGTSIGVLAAQCVSEPMTQYVLDSKHRTGGGGGSKTGAIDRVKEILGAKETEKMKNPTMLIIPLEEFEENKNKVQEIANYIEMMQFGRFTNDTRIFYESFGEPVHSKYLHEKKMIQDFKKYNLGIEIPSNLTKWCIRYSLNKEELIINSMKLETIITILRKLFPDIFFIYTPENSDELIIRGYIKNTISKNMIDTEMVIEISNQINNSVIRGIKDILSTEITKLIKSYITLDGEIDTKIVYAIVTTGSNLEDILSNGYIDIYKTQTDSIIEFEDMYGIEAARNKLIIELRKAMESVSREHCSIYADEMTYSGHITSIHRTGLQKREMSNITLRLSFQSPIQVVENAAIDGLINNINGISGPLILGTSPNIGTSYNKVLINENFIDSFKEGFDDDDL